MKVSRKQVLEIKNIVAEEMGGSFNLLFDSDVTTDEDDELEEVGIDWKNGDAYGGVGYVNFDDDGEMDGTIHPSKGTPFTFAKERFFGGKEVNISHSLETLTRIKSKITKFLT